MSLIEWLEPWVNRVSAAKQLPADQRHLSSILFYSILPMRHCLGAITPSAIGVAKEHGTAYRQHCRFKDGRQPVRKHLGMVCFHSPVCFKARYAEEASTVWHGCKRRSVRRWPTKWSYRVQFNGRRAKREREKVRGRRRTCSVHVPRKTHVWLWFFSQLSRERKEEYRGRKVGRLPLITNQRPWIDPSLNGPSL